MRNRYTTRGRYLVDDDDTYVTVALSVSGTTSPRHEITSSVETLQSVRSTIPVHDVSLGVGPHHSQGRDRVSPCSFPLRPFFTVVTVSRMGGIWRGIFIYRTIPDLPEGRCKYTNSGLRVMESYPRHKPLSRKFHH